MKPITLILIIASTFILSACDTLKDTTNTAAKEEAVAIEDTVAIVNGKYISKNELLQLEQRFSQSASQSMPPKEELLNELIHMELLTQESIHKQLDKSADYTQQLATIKKSLLQRLVIQDFLKTNPVTDAELKAEYDRTATAQGEEYKARHILLKTKQEAEALIKQLVDGADFIALAKTNSIGPSASQGGDLGWFSATQMVVPFAEATIALEKDKFTVAPIKTEFGWHIILKEGVRALTPPSFDMIKDKIRSSLQQQKMQDFIHDLRNRANVKIMLPKKMGSTDSNTEPNTLDANPTATQ